MDGEWKSTLSVSLTTIKRDTEILVRTKYLIHMLLSAEFVQKILVLICGYDHLAQSGGCYRATDKAKAARGSTSSQDERQMTRKY